VLLTCLGFALHAVWMPLGQYEAPCVENIPCIAERFFLDVTATAENEDQNPPSPVDPTAWNRIQPTCPSLLKTTFFDNVDFEILPGFTITIFRPPALAA